MREVILLNKNILAIGIVFLFVCSAFIPMSLGINTRITNTTEQPSTFSRGKTLYVGGTGDGNYTKIQDAINNASHGDTVFVYNDSSPYYEKVVIDKTTNLIGEDKDSTIIDGSQSGYNNVVSLRANGISIKGFTIKSAGRHTLYIVSHETIVTDNIISHAYLCGIYIASDNNIIYRNTVKKNSRFGINIIDGGERNQILENDLTYNEKGISLWEYCDYNVIARNTITNNDFGIALQGVDYFKGADHNKIYHNNFINNGQNALNDDYSYYNRWDNGILSGGNYWDDYTGRDRSPPYGIGDTPYIISDGNAKDRFPLMKPFKPRVVNPKINSLFLRFLEQFTILQKILNIIL